MSNADKDRDERFAAIKAKLSGDLKTCQAIENIAMRRWSDYLHIIEPYINESVEVYLYPNLHLDQSVVRTVQWIQIHVDDESVISTAQNQLAIWQTVHSQQNNDLISLIRKARATFGFDPWSQGCGRRVEKNATKIKNELLQKSAEIQEVNNSTIAAILKQLTPEQIQQLQSEQ